MRFWRLPWQRTLGPIGLDLGGNMLRAMQVRQGPDAPTRSVSIAFDDTMSLSERMRVATNAMRHAGFVGREVVIGLPSLFARMHVARLPQIESQDRSEALAWEASERAGVPKETLVADAVPTDAPTIGADGREEHLVVSADQAELTKALDVLLEAGFEPIAVEPRFASVARALSRRTRRDADRAVLRAVLHIDVCESTVLVLRGERLAFCREIPTGGAVLDGAVAIRLGVSVATAHELRLRRMAVVRGVANPVDSVMEEPALAAARPTIDALAGEVALCLRYFGVTFRGGQPAKIVVAGPNAMEPRLAGILEETCRATIENFESELPTRAEGLVLPVQAHAHIDHEDAGAWIAAYGLACRSRNRTHGRVGSPSIEREAA